MVLKGPLIHVDDSRILASPGVVCLKKRESGEQSGRFLLQRLLNEEPNNGRIELLLKFLNKGVTSQAYSLCGFSFANWMSLRFTGDLSAD